VTAEALPGLADLVEGPVDEFDLDVRWGELREDVPQLEYLPTVREVPGKETCNTQQATCPPTCPATCPATCPQTCHATCHATCAACHSEINGIDHLPASCVGPHCVLP
jgi:hypothetical protein